MHVVLTVRKLAPGSYDAWRAAWEPDELPAALERGYILRNVDDPDEVIAFGMFPDGALGLRDDPALQTQQATRMERMARYVASTGADGIFEVVEEFGPDR